MGLYIHPHEDVSWADGPSMRPKTHSRSHCCKNAAICVPDHPQMWFEQIRSQCISNADLLRSHQYLELSTCDQITQDACQARCEQGLKWKRAVLQLIVQIDLKTKQELYVFRDCQNLKTSGRGSVTYGWYPIYEIGLDRHRYQPNIRPVNPYCILDAFKLWGTKEVHGGSADGKTEVCVVGGLSWRRIYLESATLRIIKRIEQITCLYTSLEMARPPKEPEQAPVYMVIKTNGCSSSPWRSHSRLQGPGNWSVQTVKVSEGGQSWNNSEDWQERESGGRHFASQVKAASQNNDGSGDDASLSQTRIILSPTLTTKGKTTWSRWRWEQAVEENRSCWVVGMTQQVKMGKCIREEGNLGWGVASWTKPHRCLDVECEKRRVIRNI